MAARITQADSGGSRWAKSSRIVWRLCTRSPSGEPGGNTPWCSYSRHRSKKIVKFARACIMIQWQGVAHARVGALCFISIVPGTLPSVASPPGSRAKKGVRRLRGELVLSVRAAWTALPPSARKSANGKCGASMRTSQGTGPWCKNCLTQCVAAHQSRKHHLRLAG